MSDPILETIPLGFPWGTADPFAKHGPALAEKFSASSRQIATWPGGHKLPAGTAGDALVEFVREHSEAGAAA